MNDDSILGSTLGQLGQTVKQGVKQVVKLPEEMAKDVGGQIGSAKQNADENKVSENKHQWKSNEDRVKFLRDLYGSAKQNSSEVNKDDLQSPQNKKPTEFEEQIADKSPEEQKKLLELRQQLHKQNYYDPTFNPVKRQEERPAEKVEHEKKQEMVDLQKKEEKKAPPLAVIKEQNKAEMFRGASG